jgi:hypothetical protein
MYGPVRRAAGILGLLALAPTGIGLLSGTLSPADAAIRAAVTLVAARVVARVVSAWLRNAVERPGPAADAGQGEAPAGSGRQGAGAGDASRTATPRRRATDQQPAS